MKKRELIIQPKTLKYIKLRFVFCFIASLFVTIAFAQDYYVSPSGSDTNSGLSASTPFRTIQRGANMVQAGGTVFIMNGTYNRTTWGSVLEYTKAGTPDGYITFKPYPGHTPKISASEGSWNAVLIDGSYVILDGLEFEGNNANLTLAGATKAFEDTRDKIKGPQGRYNTNCMSIGNAHHVIIRNCKVHDFPAGGIGVGPADYVTIENNTIYNNSWYTMYATSGISIFGPKAIDAVTTYKIIVRGNVCYNNKTQVPWYRPGATSFSLSDGNGIILDANNGTQNKSVYTGRTLVENNICYNNGGGGVHAFQAARVDIINNTAYNNGTVVGYPEIDASDGTDCRIYNNIMYARNGGGVNSNWSNVNVIYDYNLYYNGTPEVRGPNDKIGNPQFIKLALDGSADFRVSNTSPAINAGNPARFAALDILGTSRPLDGVPDAGAYETRRPLPEINVTDGTTSIVDGGSYSFGEVTYGTSKTVAFTIENTGTGVLSLTGTTQRVVVTGAGFSVAADALATINAGGTTTFQVRLQPNVAGSFSGTISIVNNDANENPYNFAITGTGIKANQTITFNALPAKTVGDADFNPGAISSAGLAIAYSSSNTSVATIVDGLIHIVGAGTSVITASQAGNDNYNAATSVTQTLTVSLPLRTPENPANLISGLTYNYYEGVWSLLPDFNALTPVKTGTVSTPDLTPRLREDDFAFSYSGYINVPADGTYTFYTTSDDGSALYIGNTRVVNNDGLHGAVEASGAIGLKQGKHAITINFFERLNNNTLTVSYAGPGITKVLIPASAYYTTTPTLTLEAENASLNQALVASNFLGYTGTGFVDYINLSGDYIEWTANMSGAGSYTLKFRYSLFLAPRNLQITVNGVTLSSSLAFPSTASWADWQTVSITATLNAGVNTIRATANGTSGPNMDNLVIEKSGIGRMITSENLEVNQDKIYAYPNPAKNELNVTFNSEGESDASIELKTMMSHVVSSRLHRTTRGSNSVTLDLRELKSGLYLLTVKNGSRKVVKKIMVDK